MWTFFRTTTYAFWKRKKVIKGWNNTREYSQHYFIADWLFFTGNNFSIQVDSSTSWENFLVCCWEIIKLFFSYFFEKNRMVNHFTPTPNNKMLQMEMKKYSYYQECSCVCNELPGTKPTKDKVHNCMHPSQKPLEGTVHPKMTILPSFRLCPPKHF